MDLAARLEVVEAENEDLRDRVAMLEEMLGLRVDAPVEFGLTASEARIFGFLAARPLATKQAIMDLLYSTRADDAPELKITDVFICKLRKKVEPFGIEIETVWGQGWSMKQASRDKAHAMLKRAA